MSSYLRRGTALIVAAGAWLLPLMAAAEPSVQWSAPAECPSAREAKAEIAELMQRDLQTLSADARAQVEIRRVEPALLEARVAVHAGRHVREHVLRDASCASLSRAAALVVALALDPNAAPPRPEKRTPAAPPETQARDVEAATTTVAAQPAEAAPVNETPASPVDTAITVSTPSPAAPTPAAEPTPEPAPTHEPKPEPEPEHLIEPEAPPRPLKLAGFIDIAAGLTTGIIPHLAPTIALGAGLSLDALILALRLGFAPAQHATLADVASAGGRVSLAYAAFETGARVRTQSLEFPLLVGIESGFFSSRGDIPDSQTRRPAWLAPYVSGGIAYTWSQRWRLGLRVDGLVALLRPRFALDVGAAAPDVFYRPQRVGTRFHLGFGVVFE